mmetsp:Transcript_12377/g.14921  ORF Transcript_12377/g.14921 Transcript_12377/m.14921 type:complete len:117 (-) Transcript_12377:79-429(-)
MNTVDVNFHPLLIVLRLYENTMTSNNTNLHGCKVVVLLLRRLLNNDQVWKRQIAVVFSDWSSLKIEYFRKQTQGSMCYLCYKRLRCIAMITLEFTYCHLIDKLFYNTALKLQLFCL